MTDNTDTVTEMKKPIIEGTESGEPEVTEEVAATDKVEETTDQQTTTDTLEKENERLEKERKQLARTNARQGERAKEAKLAALDAIEALDVDKAKEFLESHPELEEDFNEKYPDKFTEKEVIPTSPESTQVDVNTIDREVLKAEILADTAKAASKQEQETESIQFAVDNGLNKEEQQRLKKVASALVTADSNTPFNEALGIVYQNQFGKAPAVSSPILSSQAGGSTDEPPSQEKLDWWKNNISTRITDDQAVEIQKGADEFYNSMTSGARPRE